MSVESRRTNWVNKLDAKKTSQRISRFPDPRVADETGLVCYGGTLAPDLILEAYRMGIFPWPHEGMPLLWFSPRHRGVLDFDSLHIPKRLLRTKRTKARDWRFTWDTAFAKVMNQCRHVVRKDGAGSWINDEVIAAYSDLHRQGYAHSLEVWDAEVLIGGIYGVWVDGVFSGESMFALKDDASKFALIELVQHLRACGLKWMDTQMVTSVVGMLGAHEISQEEFLERIQRAHRLAMNSILPGPCSFLPRDL